MTTRQLLNFAFWTVILLLCLYCVGKMESAAIDAEPEIHKRLFPGEFLKVFHISDGPSNQNRGIRFQNRLYHLHFADLLREFEEDKRQMDDYLQSVQKQDERRRGHSFIHFGKRINGIVKKERNKVIFQQGLQSENSLSEPFEPRSDIEDTRKTNQQNYEHRYVNERRLHLRKCLISKSKNRAYPKQPKLRKLKNNKQIRGHATMSFEKRVHRIKHPDLYIVHFGKRFDDTNLPYYQMMDFESVVDEGKQPQQHIMCLKKQRPDQQMMRYRKRIKEKERAGQSIMYLHKQIDNDLRSNKRMKFFRKRMEEEEQLGDSMMCFGKQMDGNDKPDHQMMLFKKRINEEERSFNNMIYFDEHNEYNNEGMYFQKKIEGRKESSPKMIYFGNKIEDEKRPDHHVMFFNKQKDDSNTSNHQTIHFGKRVGEKEQLSHKIMHFGKRKE
ncbi:uncharacterized protein LOC111084936 [Limulus polyphemus]|uniref:Uncharacterized protein LOC111084936 n=1 Tax=Limulus polyphemus TaxID=6850 RepID=A0ABM1S0Z5_LIMPO|nr:uncharacterized protein LOC111084936 [Limulus polyphemus]